MAHAHAFIARTAVPRHPLTLSHYWCKHFVRVDAMHAKDLKGLTAIAAGSTIMHLITHCSRLGDNQQTRLDTLNREMRRFQINNRTRHLMPMLRLTDLKDQGWHMMSGPLVKAANSRALVPFLKYAAHEYLAPHGGYANETKKVFDSLFEIERIMYSSGMFFTDAQKLEFSEQFLKLGRAWMFLRHNCHTRGVDAWQVRPKVHICMHLPAQGDLINPRFCQCYAEESLMGRVARLWRSAASGPYHASIQLSCCARYWTGLEIRLGTNTER